MITIIERQPTTIALTSEARAKLEELRYILRKATIKETAAKVIDIVYEQLKEK